jgi:hypothetical protein
VSALGVAQVASAVIVLGGVATGWVAVVRSGVRRERAELKEHARAYRAHYAAVEAAEDDPMFSPETIEQFVTEVVGLAATLWRAGKCAALDGYPDERLIRAWARSRESWLGTGLEVVGKPSTDLLSVVNRENEDEDRVVVRVRVHVHCRYPRVGLVATRHMHLDERWTLGRSGGGWVVFSMDGDPLAGPVLTAPLVPNPSSDTERLREESLAELASKQKVGDDVALSDLLSVGEPPALALFDLSLLDGRFESTLIATELAHLLVAWEEAVTGSEGPFEELASAQARTTLLRPRRGTRLVLRDAVLRSWEPTRLELARQPPTIEVALDVEAVRFVVTDRGSHLAGDETDPRRIGLTWILELSGSTQAPWRLASSNNPAEAIPGWSVI